MGLSAQPSVVTPSDSTSWAVRHLYELGAIGATPRGGRTRLTLTPQDEQGRQYVKSLMAELGLRVREDALGNLFGRFEGQEAGLSPVLIGSHIDTVPDAGAFDGCLGVMSALAVVRTFRALGLRPRRPLEVVAFTGEESSRFGLALIGSRALAGTLDPATLDRYRDSEGNSLARCLEARGITAENLPALSVPRGHYHCYVELHIDQGSYLDEAGCPIGIVTGIAAPIRVRFVLRGEAAHSGATPFQSRRDALMAAAQILVEVERVAREEAPTMTVATVGQLQVWPNVINVVPGEVQFSLDLRGTDEASRRRLLRAIQRAVAREAARRRLDVVAQVLAVDAPVQLDEGLQQVMVDVCNELGVRWMRLPSMAGHDAMQMARICPAGMLFVRNRSRISHSPQEAIDPEDIEAGIRVLFGVVRRLVDGVDRAEAAPLAAAS